MESLLNKGSLCMKGKRHKWMLWASSHSATVEINCEQFLRETSKGLFTKKEKKCMHSFYFQSETNGFINSPKHNWDSPTYTKINVFFFFCFFLIIFGWLEKIRNGQLNEGLQTGQDYSGKTWDFFQKLSSFD